MQSRRAIVQWLSALPFFAALAPLRAVRAATSTNEVTSQSELSSQRALWESMTIADYHYTVQSQSGGLFGRPSRVTVRNGKVVRARILRYAFRPGADLEFDITETDEEAAEFERRTMSQWFEMASQLLVRYGDGNLKVRFDEDYGFPLKIYGDTPDAADADTTIEISDFEID